MQTFFAGDSEIFQHKSYAVLLLVVRTDRSCGLGDAVAYVCHHRGTYAIRPFAWPPSLSPYNCDDPCPYGCHGGDGRFIEIVV
jgi:hypothetical protein